MALSGSVSRRIERVQSAEANGADMRMAEAKIDTRAASRTRNNNDGDISLFISDWIAFRTSLISLARLGVFLCVRHPTGHLHVHRPCMPLSLEEEA